MQEALQSTFVADFEALFDDLPTDELLHLSVAASRCDCGISCFTEWRLGPCLRTSWNVRWAWSEVMAIRLLHWTVWQVPKERAIICACPCNLFLHRCKSLVVIIAIIPMNKAMKICQIANIKPLFLYLPSDKKGHLMMAAQL